VQIIFIYLFIYLFLLGTNSLYKLIAYYFNLHIIAYLLYICTTYKAHIDAFFEILFVILVETLFTC